MVECPGLRRSYVLAFCAVGLSVLAASADRIPPAVEIQAKPETALLGTPVHVAASGLKPGGTATIRNRSTDGNGRTWEAVAEFEADSNGQVDCGRDAPRSGSYAGVDPAGLFWSMKPALSMEERTPSYRLTGLVGMKMEISVESAGHTVATASVSRTLERPDFPVAHETVRSQGLVAVLHHPASGGPYPGLILHS